MEHKNKAEEKSINKTISEQFEEIKEQMCDHYCKYAESWDEDDGEIRDSPICKECPLNKLRGGRMTIDEHIHKAEEDAKMAEIEARWGIGSYFIDRTEALEYAKECRQLAEWLKELKQLREQTSWTPITKRPPDEYGRYLISTDDGMVEIVNYGDTNDLPNEIAFYQWDDEGWQCWKPNVTAWMPLPKPYEPQEREGHMNCEDCDYTDIADWEQDKKTGKAKPVYWCERYRKLCSSISECQYKAESEG